MSLVLKNRGTNSSLFTLGEGCFDKVNDADVAGARAPYGVLGGSLAAIRMRLSRRMAPKWRSVCS